MFDLIMVRYGEMTLKKKNYMEFQHQANASIRRKLKDVEGLVYREIPYRLYIELGGADADVVTKALDQVPGLHSYSLCVKSEANYEAIAERALSLLGERKGSYTFKVETKRSDKTFPATSLEISREVASRVLPRLSPDVHVDVHTPDVILSIEVRSEGTFVSLGETLGLGGLPAGSSGNGILMISGGIDSPVAGYLALRKGIRLTALHFAAPPYTSPLALQKVRDLLALLAPYAPNEEIALKVVPFTAVEDRIHEKAKENYMITVLRRAMYRIANRVADDEHALCLVNGESIGQVASQTLESMRAIESVTSYPVIRPLATCDKDEVIRLARKIGTYDISVRPYEDCCTVFVPLHPVIKPRVIDAQTQEDFCDLSGLIDEAYRGIEESFIRPTGNPTVFDQEEEKGTSHD